MNVDMVMPRFFITESHLDISVKGGQCKVGGGGVEHMLILF